VGTLSDFSEHACKTGLATSRMLDRGIGSR
jgi:hypothetical protein